MSLILVTISKYKKNPLKSIIDHEQQKTSPDLRKILSKAKFSSSNESSIQRCNDQGCGTGVFIQDGDGITLKRVHI